VEDFRGAVNKDNYPSCRFEYNSLGYRDSEPPAATGDRRLVLLFGDSFVWGDGIPTNAETIGALLRDELERKAPGQFAVMVAAYPALGPYGYRQIIRTLTPIYRPAAVLVHYVPEAHLLSDPQLLVDRLPGNAFVRNLILAISGPRFLNEAITIADSWLSHLGTHIGESVVDPPSILAELAEDATRGGHRVILFLYGKPGQPTRPPFPLPRPLERLDLPEAWAYPGVSTDLWYAKDSHPKPKLNRLVAAYLADVVLAGPRPE
jgi:predicted heme/steroid binding protein